MIAYIKEKPLNSAKNWDEIKAVTVEVNNRKTGNQFANLLAHYRNVSVRVAYSEIGNGLYFHPPLKAH